MILTLGLAPALQQIMIFHSVEPGKVNRAGQVHYCASAKSLNAAKALSSLGVETQVLSPLGGHVGDVISEEFQQLGIPAQWVRVKSSSRICTTVIDQTSGHVTELVENAGELLPHELEAIRTTFFSLAPQAQAVVCTGSLPANTSETIYLSLLAQYQGIVVLDAQGPELMCALQTRPRVVKPNLEELANTVGRELKDNLERIAAMRMLLDCGAGSVVVTDGSNLVWLAEGEDVWQFRPLPVVEVRNPIGCGDCLAAGLAWGLTMNYSLVDALRLGMACAAQNLTDWLPARLDAEVIKNTWQKVEYWQL